MGVRGGGRGREAGGVIGDRGEKEKGGDNKDVINASSESGLPYFGPACAVRGT